jgi:hypothetical protein
MMVMAVGIVVPSFCMAIFITHVEHWNSLNIWTKENRSYDILHKVLMNQC